MAYIPAATGSNAASAAAVRKLKDEEKIMTPYEKDDLEGWEFKIIKSFTGRFNDNEYVQRLRREEARAGWEMLEKFDDYRIRFKRKTDNRPNDRFLKFDPYRTNVGFGINQILAVILGVAVLSVGLAIIMAIFIGG